MNIGILRCSIAAILFGISAPAAALLTNDMGPFTLAVVLGGAVGLGLVPAATAAIDQITPSQITLAKGIIAGGTNLIIGLASTPTPHAGPIRWALLIGAVGYGASITL